MPFSRLAFIIISASLVSSFMPSVFAANDAQQYPARGSSSILRVEVDATDVNHRILSVTEQIPVFNEEEVTLYFPKWIPGTHAPSGPIDDLSGLIIRAQGRPIEWRRDMADMNAFHVRVPRGTHQLDVQFQTLCSESTPSAMTTRMVEIEWNTVSLYPKNIPFSELAVSASLRLPVGWQYGTALTTVTASASLYTFETTSYARLVDSPVLAAVNFRQIDLTGADRVPVRLDIAADHQRDLEIKPFQVTAMKQLVQQAKRLFNSRHYDHYDFLLSISDELKFRGLEHLESSEDGIKSGYFNNWSADGSVSNQLLPHELVHSWNGKYRRPQDLTTPDFETPMQNSLLWVYEGLTEYWGYILAARSGLQSMSEAKDDLALRVAAVSLQQGREWRDLQDTTNTEILTDARMRPFKWRSWQRGMDYYSEGSLIWLEADSIIRQRSKGRRSLDDFASTFFNGEKKSTPNTYNFDELIRGLNDVEPFDWRGYFLARLRSHDHLPPNGLEASGYRLVFSDNTSEYQASKWKSWKEDDFYFSLGLSIEAEGKLAEVVWNSAAFAGGLAPGMEIVAINGDSYTAERLSDAIKAAKKGGPLELLIKNEGTYRTVALNYHDGLRYPHLEKIAKSPLLDKIFSPK